MRSSAFRHPARKVAKEFLVIDAPDWAIVLALTPAGELVLVRQFRFGAQQISLEFPGGVIEAGEAPARGAARELREETGYTGADPIVLGTVFPNPAIQSNRAHIILITDAVCTDPLQWDADEELSLSLRPVVEVIALARAGGMLHALMLNALFLFEPWWREQQRARDEAGI